MILAVPQSAGGGHVKLPAMSHQQAARLQQVMALMCQAIACNGAGLRDQALSLIDQALAHDPDFIPAHMQRVALLEQAGQLAQAIAACEACLLVAPSFQEARQARERLLLAQVARYEEQGGDALVMARALHQLRRLPQALAHAQAALAAEPEHFAARVLVADILLQLNRHEEALTCYAPRQQTPEQALLSDFNRADILRQMGRFDEAFKLLEQVVAARANFAEAQVAYAHLLLMRGDYQAGWQAHEMRHAIAALASRCPRPDIPAWQTGQDISGKQVLLWAEQGLGDSLQFARYIAPVAARAAAVTVCAPAGLLSLLARAFPSCQFVADARHVPAHDVQASLMSLPWLLATPDPAHCPAAPYLHALPSAATAWRTQLDQALPATATGPRRPRVGLVWAGRQFAQVNHSRDIPLASLLPLLVQPVDFVALQPELPAADEAVLATLVESEGRLVRFALGDWSDTAALVSGLDLVIAVDTAVAHLAGAMGKPVWLLARHEGEWRWGMDALTPWYPAMRIMRQARPGQWVGVVAQAVQCLQSLTVPLSA